MCVQHLADYAANKPKMLIKMTWQAASDFDKHHTARVIPQLNATVSLELPILNNRDLQQAKLLPFEKRGKNATPIFNLRL